MPQVEEQWAEQTYLPPSINLFMHVNGGSQ